MIAAAQVIAHFFLLSRKSLICNLKPPLSVSRDDYTQLVARISHEDSTTLLNYLNQQQFITKIKSFLKSCFAKEKIYLARRERKVFVKRHNNYSSRVFVVTFSRK